VPACLHPDKLFTRICGVVWDRFAEPEFGPCEVAAQAGISLRYLRRRFGHTPGAHPGRPLRSKAPPYG
jgi:hypothetical protein